jgi:hypothetical protein
MGELSAADANAAANIAQQHFNLLKVDCGIANSGWPGDFKSWVLSIIARQGSTLR